MKTVSGKRRMASGGYGVVSAPTDSATRVMEEISSIYLARPRTSMGFAEQQSNVTISRQSHSSAASADSAGAAQRKCVLPLHDKEQAFKYFTKFSTLEKSGERVLPYARLDRMLHSLKIVPTLISISDIESIFNFARGKEAGDDVKPPHLTEQEFYRGVFHVCSWTGRSFLDMSLVAEQLTPSRTNRKDWTDELRSSAYKHPLLSKSVESLSQVSLSSLAQSSLPALQPATLRPATPLLGVIAPKSKKEYLELRKHMKIARFTSVKPKVRKSRPT